MSIIIQSSELNRLAPGLTSARCAEITDGLVPALEEFEISINSARLCACLAQFAHESVGFRYLRELGGRSYTAKYDFREDLGNHKVGMGYIYRGGGFIQITGFTNYKKAGDALGLDLANDPQLIEDVSIAARVSCWWWQTHGLNELADVNTLDNYKKITKRINGGYNGLEGRIRFWETAKTIWN